MLSSLDVAESVRNVTGAAFHRQQLNLWGDSDVFAYVMDDKKSDTRSRAPENSAPKCGAWVF